MELDLLNLFEGNSKLFITTSLTGEVDERGKRESQTLTVHAPVSKQIWKEHLEGSTRIGIKPETDNDTCKWGCIDIDPHNYKDYNQKKIVDIIRDYNLPLIPVRSKSGGLHLFLFLDKFYPVKEVKKELDDINNNFFQALEVFPMNKCLNMPYFNKDSTTEFAYNEHNTPMLIGAFLQLAKSKKISLQSLNKNIKQYEPESNWKQYPPCCQKIIQEKWTGNHRNDLLFNMGVLEMKKADGNLSKKEITTILLERNKQIFASPLPDREVIATVANSVSKKDYALKCNTPLCDKDKCRFRALGIGSQPPPIVTDFTEISFIKSTKSIEYSFKYQDQYIIVTPEDMKDEKSWRTKLLRYGIYWMTLPRPKSGPPPFELMLREIVTQAVENDKMKFEDTLGEEKYTFLKKFFEAHIEEDDYEKLKDNYVVLDSKTNTCYFRRITFEKFLGNDKTFKSASEALSLLGCERLEYHEGVKNVWKVEMPSFVDHGKIKQKIKDKTSEMDDEYHTGKFRT